MSIQLPSITTVEGVVVRLLLVETSAPGLAQYNEASALQAMQAMKAVVHNRLHNFPAQFGAPNATSYIDIITVPGQFTGFSRDSHGNVAISADQQKRIDELLNLANTGTPGKFSRFVSNAINVANSNVQDPFANVKKIGTVAVTGGGYGWRATRLADPGGNFVPIPTSLGGVIQGNKFYALKAKP